MERKKIIRLERIGEERIMNCGMKAKIVGQNKNDEIILMFDNGIIKKTDYSAFCCGFVHP